MGHFLKEPAAPVPATDAARVRATVSEMLLAIERGGIDAVRRYSAELDGWRPESFRVERDAPARAAATLDDDLLAHIAFAQRQVSAFARAQRAALADISVETLPGVTLGHRVVPVAAAGAYIPGGRYPLLASAFMTVLVAKQAGVERVVACAPPSAGSGIDPAALWAIGSSGADEILCIGGVQAIALLALGLGELEPVDLVVGPGNAYVSEAKRQLFGRIGIDLLAGPSELLLIADESADPVTLASDLLAQAEHGPTSVVELIVLDAGLGRAVLAEVERQLEGLPTRAIAAAAWAGRGSVYVAEDHDDALRTADRRASEHVHVQVRDDVAERYLGELRNYGSLFLGERTTVVYGDKAAGTNHCLPTGGAARYTGGLSVLTFLKVLTHQRMTAEGAATIAPAAVAIATAEGLAGHARSAALRLAAAT